MSFFSVFLSLLLVFVFIPLPPSPAPAFINYRKVFPTFVFIFLFFFLFSEFSWRLIYIFVAAINFVMEMSVWWQSPFIFGIKCRKKGHFQEEGMENVVEYIGPTLCPEI